MQRISNLLKIWTISILCNSPYLVSLPVPYKCRFKWCGYIIGFHHDVSAKHVRDCCRAQDLSTSCHSFRFHHHVTGWRLTSWSSWFFPIDCLSSMVPVPVQSRIMFQCACTPPQFGCLNMSISAHRHSFLPDWIPLYIIVPSDHLPDTLEKEPTLHTFGGSYDLLCVFYTVSMCHSYAAVMCAPCR